MTASPNIKTPAMEVPLHRSSGAKVEGERLKKYFTRVTLDQVESLVDLLSGVNQVYSLCKGIPISVGTTVLLCALQCHFIIVIHPLCVVCLASPVYHYHLSHSDWMLSP